MVVLAGLWLPAAPAWAQTPADFRDTINDWEAVFVAPADPNLAGSDIPAPPRRKQAATDPYAAPGIGTGGLRLFASLGIGSVVTSNVQSSPRAEADAGLYVRPSVRIESDWVRHAWTANANGDLIFYGAHSDLDTRDFDLSQQLRLDIRRHITTAIDASFVQSQSGLEDSGVPATAVGYRTERTAASSASLIQDFGGVEARLRAGASWHWFGDVELSGGGVEDNSDRDYMEPVVALRAIYSDAPVFKPYVEAAYTPRYHRREIDRNGLRRDSDGYAVNAGMVIDAGPLWTGDVALTYLWRGYDDPLLASNHAFGLTGKLAWSPGELTRIVLSFDTSLPETVAAGASGSREWTVGLGVNQSVRDNVDVFARASAELRKTDGATDVTYTAGTGLAWKANPYLAWTASYDATWLDAADASRDYTEHRFLAGLTLSR